MVRFARQRRVFFFEEPIFTGSWPHLHLETCPQTGVEIATPFLREGTSSVDAAQAQRDMLADLIADQDVVLHSHGPGLQPAIETVTRGV